MKLSPSTIEACKKQIREANHILITTHVNPDGDAVGSALGLKAILSAAGIDSKVVVPNDYPDFLKWMTGTADVLSFEDNQAEATALVQKADLIFHLDYNSLNRSGDMEEVLRSSRAQRIIIDHHQQPEATDGILISEPGMSSTCEMIYHFVVDIDMENYVNLAAAECLYTGLITDTGNFRFSSTTSRTHYVAGKLLDLGVKPHEIAGWVYDNNSMNRLALLGRTLDRMEIMPEFCTAVMSLSGEDLSKFEYQKGDTEGFVNYGLSVKGIAMSVFFSEKDGMIKISFRSKGDFNVNKLARELFDGGGHVNAAGAVSKLSLPQAIQKLKDVLPDYKDELQNTL